jgi:hypothetical protein
VSTWIDDIWFIDRPVIFFPPLREDDRGKILQTMTNNRCVRDNGSGNRDENFTPAAGGPGAA